MEFLNRMSEVIGYMEDHILEDFDLNDASRIVCLNSYQFSRVFSCIFGMTPINYVRARRLSLAALELQAGRAKVLDTALKYGYSSPEAFARAFRELHGISPREACARGAQLRMFPRIALQITVKGDTDMEYRMEERGVIHGLGITRNFGQWRVRSEEDTWMERMGERWAFWDEYLNGGMDRKIADLGLYRSPFYQMGVTHVCDNGNIVESIGAESDGNEYEGLEPFEIPAATWAVFTARGSLGGKDHPIDALATQIFTEWMPSSGYEKAMEYEIQVYGPGNSQSEDYACELWIPVKKKKR
jgi:AraC family transcriptional regulator